MPLKKSRREVPTMSDKEQYPPAVDPEEATEELTSKEDLTQEIPGFHLLQKLGEGGMGEVFEAEQFEPVRRRVALKLIKRGMESKEVLARFETIPSGTPSATTRASRRCWRSTTPTEGKIITRRSSVSPKW